MNQSKEKPKKLSRVYVLEISTNRILVEFLPTKMGEKQANRFMGLADLRIVKEYQE